MARFRRKVTEIEAVTWNGTAESLEELAKFTRGRFRMKDEPDIEGRTGEVFDQIHSTWIAVGEGDKIVPGPHGEFYPINKHAFEELYVPIEA